MNKAYLLILCLLSASFTGCIEDAEEIVLDEFIEEESLKDENCLQIKGQYLGDEVEATAAMKFLGSEYNEDQNICILSSHLVDIDEGKKLFVNEDGTNYIIRQQISGTSDNFTLTTFIVYSFLLFSCTKNTISFPVKESLFSSSWEVSSSVALSNSSSIHPVKEAESKHSMSK